MRVTLLITLSLILNLAARAQVNIGFDFTLLGNYADFNKSDYLNAYEKMFRPGFDIGFLSELEIINYIALDAGIKYGERSNLVVQQQAAASEIIYHLSYIHIPVLLKLKLNKGPIKWFIKFGPDVHYLIGGNINYRYYDGSLQSFSEHKFMFFNSNNTFLDFEAENINRWQLGLVLGSGVEWKVQRYGKIAINFQYAGIHTFLSNTQNQGPFHPDITSDFRFGNNSLGINLAYLHNLTSIIKDIKR